MAVRKIPKNYNYVTGGFASHKRTSMAGYESPLEHEYMLLLEFGPEVETFEEQPIRIWFKGETGRKKPYVPDVLAILELHPLTRDAFDHEAKIPQQAVVAELAWIVGGNGR
jgi:hypothetical protein